MARLFDGAHEKGTEGDPRARWFRTCSFVESRGWLRRRVREIPEKRI